MSPLRFTLFLALTLGSCRDTPAPTSSALARFNRISDLEDALPPAPAQLAVVNQTIRSSQPSPVVLRNLQLARPPIAAFLFGNTSREQLERTVVKNFSMEFSNAQPAKEKKRHPQLISAGDDSEISGFLSYQEGTLILASRGYRGTSLVGLPVDIDANPNTNNRSQRLFWFPKGYEGKDRIHYDGLHLLVIFASIPYPSGLELMQANERIGNQGPVRQLPKADYQIINVQGQISLSS